MASYLASKHGIDAATEVADFELDNVRAVEEYVRNSGADCDFFLTRAVDVQLSESHNTSLKAGYDRLIDASVESTKSVFYLHGKDAEMVCRMLTQSLTRKMALISPLYCLLSKLLFKASQLILRFFRFPASKAPRAHLATPPVTSGHTK